MVKPGLPRRNHRVVASLLRNCNISTQVPPTVSATAPSGPPNVAVTAAVRLVAPIPPTAQALLTAAGPGAGFPGPPVIVQPMGGPPPLPVPAVPLGGPPPLPVPPIPPGGPPPQPVPAFPLGGPPPLPVPPIPPGGPPPLPVPPIPPGGPPPLPVPPIPPGGPPPPPPPGPPPQPLVPQQGPHVGQVGPLAANSDRSLLVFARLLLQKRGLQFMKNELDLMELNSTAPLHFSKNELTLAEKSISLAHGIRHFFTCASCKDTLPNSISFCENAPCRLFGHNPTVKLSDKRVLTVICNAECQLTEVIQSNISTIMSSHSDYQQHRHTSRRDDCRFFPRFRRAVESGPQFRRNKITVQLLLSSDGFCFRGNERGSTWITSVKLLDLDPGERTKRCNTVILSSISAGRHPQPEEFRISLTAFLELVRRSRVHPIVVTHMGNQIEVQLKVSMAVMDGQAVALCFRIKGGAGYHGCSRCYSPGFQRGHRHTWPFRRYVIRTPLECKRDSRLAINGVAGRSVFGELVPMCAIATDFLHCACEGMLKKYLEETFLAPPLAAGLPRHNRGLRLSNAERDDIAEIISSSSMPTYSRALLRSSKDIKKMNGSQVFELSCTILPIVSLELMHPDRNQSAIIMCLLMVLKVESTTKLDKKMCVKLANILTSLSPLHDKYFGDEWASIKKHFLFDHHKEDLLHVGIPAELSSASFEKDYRLLKQSVEMGNTRAVTVSAIKRHVILSSLSSEMQIRVNRGAVGMEKTFMELIGKGAAKMPQGVEMDSVRLSIQDLIPHRNLPPFQLLARLGCTEYRRRVLVNGQSYSGELAKVLHTTTQQNVISFLYNGSVATGSLLCFGVDNNLSRVHAAVSRYSQHCPFSELKRRLRLTQARDFRVLPILKQCSRVNRYWFRVNRTNTTLVSIKASDILGPGCIIQSPSGQTDYFVCKAGRAMPE